MQELTLTKEDSVLQLAKKIPLLEDSLKYFAKRQWPRLNSRDLL